MWAPHISAKEALQTEVEHFVDCVRTGTRPISSGVSGLRVVEVLEAAPFDRGAGQAGSPEASRSGPSETRVVSPESAAKDLIVQVASGQTMNTVQRSILFSALERYGSLLLLFVSTAVLSRLLHPDEFGIYAVVNAMSPSLRRPSRSSAAPTISFRSSHFPDEIFARPLPSHSAFR